MIYRPYWHSISWENINSCDLRNGCHIINTIYRQPFHKTLHSLFILQFYIYLHTSGSYGWHASNIMLYNSLKSTPTHVSPHGYFVCLYFCSKTQDPVLQNMYPWKQGSWGQHGPIWGRQDPGGPHVGPMNFAIWDVMGRGKLPVLGCIFNNSHYHSTSLQ